MRSSYRTVSGDADSPPKLSAWTTAWRRSRWSPSSRLETVRPCGISRMEPSVDHTEAAKCLCPLPALDLGPKMRHSRRRPPSISWITVMRCPSRCPDFVIFDAGACLLVRRQSGLQHRSECHGSAHNSTIGAGRETGTRLGRVTDQTRSGPTNFQRGCRSSACHSAPMPSRGGEK